MFFPNTGVVFINYHTNATLELEQLLLPLPFVLPAPFLEGSITRLQEKIGWNKMSKEEKGILITDSSRVLEV